MNISWVKLTTGGWPDLELVNLDNANTGGVYVIWHTGRPGRYVKVGQANDIATRLSSLRANPAILTYRAHGGLRVTWATVPASDRDGVERFLGDRLKPLVADRFPDVQPIPVNLPHAA